MKRSETDQAHLFLPSSNVSSLPVTASTIGGSGSTPQPQHQNVSLDGSSRKEAQSEKKPSSSTNKNSSGSNGNPFLSMISSRNPTPQNQTPRLQPAQSHSATTSINDQNNSLGLSASNNNSNNNLLSQESSANFNGASSIRHVLGREFASRDTYTLIMAIVVAILIVLLIISVASAMWSLIEPYSVPLVGAGVLSVAFHEPIEFSSFAKRYPVSQAILDARQDFQQKYPRLGLYFSPLVAIPTYFYHLLQSALMKFGVDKYPLVHLLPGHVQNVGFFVMLVLVAGRLASFLFPSYVVGVLISSAVLGGIPIGCAFILCWFLPARKFVQIIRTLTSVITVVVISLLFTFSIVTELHQGGQRTVATIQDLGINIPDNAFDVASSYILSANTTATLLPAIKQLSFNGTWDEVYNNTMKFVTNHTTALTAAFDESKDAAKGVAGVVTRAVTFVLTLLFWSFGKLYEGFLFLMTLSVLLSLDHSLLYYILKKVLTVVFGDEKKAKTEAKKTESRLIGELTTLFYSLWHVFVFHFLATLIWYSAFDMPFSVTVSTVGGLVALFPLSLPPMVTQIIIACIIMAIRRNFQFEMLIVGCAFWYASICVDLIVVSEAELPTQKQFKKAKSADNVSEARRNSNSTSTAMPSCISSVSEAGVSKSLRHFVGLLKKSTPSGTPLRTSGNSSGNDDNNNGITTSASFSSSASSSSSLSKSALDANIQAAQQHIAEKQQPFEKASAYLVTTSIVLGLTAYGPLGVVVGPIVFIVAHALWDAF